MAEISWIKLSTTMFDDEKIQLIQAMPESDAIIVIWVRLLALAGKTNDDGLIYIQRNMPYTEEMLATLFGKNVNTVRLALNTLSTFNMIDISQDGFLAITNWEKHQNVEGMERIREQNRLRAKKHYEKKKLQNSNVSLTLTNGTDIDKELDKEKEKEKDILSSKHDTAPYSKIIHYLNDQTGKKYKVTDKWKKLIQARMNEGQTYDDFIKVIDTKVKQWKNDAKMNQYLRPQTLFGNKFDEYLNEYTQPVNSNREQEFEEAQRKLREAYEQ